MERTETEQVKTDQNSHPATTLPEDVQVLRRQLARGVLRALTIVGIFVAVAGTYDAIISNQVWTLPFYWLTYGVVVLFTFWPRFGHRFRTWVLLTLIYVLGAVDLAQDGPAGSGRLFIAIVPFLAGLLLSYRESVMALVVSVLIMGGFGTLFATNILSVPGYVGASDPTRWLTGTLVVLMFDVLMVVAVNFFLQRMSTSLVQSRDLAEDLERERAGLEIAVEERTEALKRRARYLEATAEVARGASLLLDDPDTLLDQVVNLIAQEFGFYNVGIFLVDSTNTWVDLRAASSEGGRRMMAHGFRMRVGLQGIVGYVAERGEPRVVSDVSRDLFFQEDLDLPETRSEVALPLRVRTEIIGVLDVQSVTVNTFSEENVAVLQSLADQVALAIYNARLFQQVQESVEAERLARGELSREAWLEMLQLQPDLGFVKEQDHLIPVEEVWDPEMQQALHLGEPVVSDEDQAALAVPIQVGGRTVAVLDAHLPGEAGAWSEDQVSLLEALSAQLGQALDRARLYQETQLSAARERAVGQVTARMREPLELEDVLRTAAHEMREALNLEELVIHLRAETGDGSAVDKEDVV